MSARESVLFLLLCVVATTKAQVSVPGCVSSVYQMSEDVALFNAIDIITDSEFPVTLLVNPLGVSTNGKATLSFVSVADAEIADNVVEQYMTNSIGETWTVNIATPQAAEVTFDSASILSKTSSVLMGLGFALTLTGVWDKRSMAMLMLVLTLTHLIHAQTTCPTPNLGVSVTVPTGWLKTSGSNANLVSFAKAGPCTGAYVGQPGACECTTGFSGSVTYVNAQPTGCTANPCAATQIAGSIANEAEGSIVGGTGDKVTIECKDGFQGGAEIECGTDGKFTEVSCVGIPCAGEGYKGDDGLCSCAIGFQGSVSYVDGAPTGCVGAPCTDTQVEGSVAYEATGSIAGTTGNKVTVSCKPGYLGGGEIQCQASGEWQSATCTAQACAATQVEFSDKSLERSISGTTGVSVTVTCNAGYSGSGAAVCGTDQVFSTVTCTANTCTPTGGFADSDKSGTGVITGTTGQKTYVTCNAGFGGSGNVVCQTDGVFSSVSCEAGGCESTTIEHSTTNPIQGSTGQSVAIVCEQGYALSGGSSVTCQAPSGGDASGKFTTGVTCEPVSCSATQVANSDHKGTGSITGKTLDAVKVTCDQGYEGGGTVQCTTSSSFTKTLCSPSACAPRMVDFSDKKNDGSITGVTGQKVTVTCDTGYTGSGQVECLTTGKFTDLTCTGIPCSGAYEGTPGQCVCASDYVGTVTYTLGGLTSGCTKCPSNSYSPPGNGLACSPIACDEASGYTGTAGQCTCIYGYAGTVVYWNGMTTGCAGIPCSEGYLGEPGQCSCAAGYAGTAGYTAGKPSGCNKCAAGSWSNPGDLTCFGLPCYGAYAGSPGKCTCADGFYGTASYNAMELLGCTACATGKWATAGNGKTCAAVACTSPGYTGTAGACKCDGTTSPPFVGSVEYVKGKLTGCYSTGACKKNEYVQDKVCLICPPGTTNPAGDSPTGANTKCTPTYCIVNKYVSGYRCLQTILGYTSPAGADCSKGSSPQTSTPCDLYEVPNSNKAAVGSINLKTNAYVDVVCNPGYKGGGFATCYPSLFYNYTGNHPNGRVSPVSCTKDVAFCPAFGVTNGSPCLASSIGQTCTVTCASGYTGTTTVTCDGTGNNNWSGRPVCRPAAEAACPAGTTASGSGCLEVDGCALDPKICGDPNIVQCVDQPAPATGHKCQCNKGYIMIEKACRLVWTSAGTLSSLDSIRTLYPGDKWEYGISYVGGDIQNALITTWNQGLRVTLYPFTPMGENHATLVFAATVFTKGLSDAASATKWYHNTFVVNRDSSIASKASDGVADTVVVYVRPLLRPWKYAGPMIISSAVQSQYNTNRWTYGTLYKNKPTLENPVQNTQPADIQRLYINRWNYGWRHHTFPIQPAGDALEDMSFAHHMWTANLASSPGGDTLYTYRSVQKFPLYLLHNPPGGDIANDQSIWVRERTSTFVETSAMGFTNGDTTKYTASFPDARKDVLSHQFAMKYNGEYQVIYTNTWARQNGHRVTVYPPYPQGDSFTGLVFGTAVWTRNATNMYSYSPVIDGIRYSIVTDDPTHWYHWYYRFNNRYSASYALDDYRDGSGGGNWDMSCVTGGPYYFVATGCKRQAYRALVNTWIPAGPLKSFSRTLFPSTTFEYGIETRGGDIRPFIFSGGSQGLRGSAFPIMPQGDDGKAMDFGTIVFGKGLQDHSDPKTWYQADFRFPSPMLAEQDGQLRSGDDEVIYIRFHEQTDDAYYNGL